MAVLGDWGHGSLPSWAPGRGRLALVSSMSLAPLCQARLRSGQKGQGSSSTPGSHNLVVGPQGGAAVAHSSPGRGCGPVCARRLRVQSSGLLSVARAGTGALLLPSGPPGHAGWSPAPAQPRIPLPGLTLRPWGLCQAWAVGR